MTEKKYSNLVNVIIGILLIILNICWIYFQLRLLYNYNFGNILYLYKIPEWILVLNTICGLIGVLLAVRLIKELNIFRLISNQRIIWKPYTNYAHGF